MAIKFKRTYGKDVDLANKELEQLIGGNGLKDHVFLLGDRHDTPKVTYFRK